MRTTAALAVLLAAALTSVATAQEGVPAHRVETSERALGPYPLTDGAVGAVLTVDRLVPDSLFTFTETVTAVRFVDLDGTMLYERPLPNRVTVDGFDRSWDASIHMLELGRGEVLHVTYELVPSAPFTGQAVRLFGWTDHSFGPLGMGITGTGTFVELPPGEAEGAVGLLGGGVPFDAWTGHFVVRVPLRVDLYGIGSTPTGPWALRGGMQSDLVLGELDVLDAERQVWDDAVRDVPLYDSPDAETSYTVPIRPDSEVAFGPAYGRVQLVPDRTGEMATIEVEIIRLHVVIDGQEGWTDAYDALGLPAAG